MLQTTVTSVVSLSPDVVGLVALVVTVVAGDGGDRKDAAAWMLGVG